MPAPPRPQQLERRRLCLFAAAASVLALASGAAATPGAGGGARRPHAQHARHVKTAIPRARHGIRVWTVHYRSHLGLPTAAYVALPAGYLPGGKNPPLPLVISPHGRGVSGRANLHLWGSLPAKGSFAVVSPDGQGRVLPLLSWGYPGQVDDLARMPRILRLTLPWLRLAPRHVYAFGGSMGGQETLLLVARHPRLLAGAAAFDSVTDFAAQYRNFRALRCGRVCTRDWGAPLGLRLQSLAKIEVGGSPRTAPHAFARRSPLEYVRRIAFSRVRLQLWWSLKDQLVPEQQSQALAVAIDDLNPRAPVMQYIGWWRHSAEMRWTTRLPIALMDFGLLPRDYPIGKFTFLRRGM